jgi:nucleoside-diphosphate-sugar epimerase
MSTILLVGGRGFLGQHLHKELIARGHRVFAPARGDYDVSTQVDAFRAVSEHMPDIIINLCGHVGGIEYNRERPAQLFVDNFLPGFMLLRHAHHFGIKKFVQIGSVCEYPKLAPVPLKEESLWDGYPEPTNAPYGIAKRSLLEMGQAYRKQYGMNVVHILLANLYGPHDNFDDGCHVIPATIKKFLKAGKSVTMWGSGHPTRDFLYVDDAASAVALLAEKYNSGDPINVGTGHMVSIREMASMVSKITGYCGTVEWDTSRPDGQPKRGLDISRISKLGWKPHFDLEQGLKNTVDWYKGEK